MDEKTISFLVLIIGCAVGISGWLSTREKKSSGESEWRGMIAAKLDSIYSSVTGLNQDVARIDERLNDHAERLAKVEASAKQAHHRIDNVVGSKDPREE